MSKIKSTVIRSFSEIMNIDIDETIDIKKDLKEFGIDSISFIKLIVNLEEKFEMEFEDEMLTQEALKNLDEIIKYIENRCIE